MSATVWSLCLVSAPFEVLLDDDLVLGFELALEVADLLPDFVFGLDGFFAQKVFHAQTLGQLEVQPVFAGQLLGQLALGLGQFADPGPGRAELAAEVLQLRLELPVLLQANLGLRLVLLELVDGSDNVAGQAYWCSLWVL